MKNFIWKYFRHSAIQSRFMRKWFKGTYYFVATNMPMPFYWVESTTKNNINVCQGKIIKLEVHPENGIDPEKFDSFDRQHLWLNHTPDEDALYMNNKGMFCKCCEINFTTDSITHINKYLNKKCS